MKLTLYKYAIIIIIIFIIIIIIIIWYQNLKKSCIAKYDSMLMLLWIPNGVITVVHLAVLFYINVAGYVFIQH